MKIIDYNKYECIKTEQTKPENEKADKYSKPFEAELRKRKQN